VFLVLSLLPAGVRAQADAAQKTIMDQLTGGNTRQWSIVGTKAAPGAPCATADRYYTFHRAPAQVVVQECQGGKFTARTLPLTSWTANGRTGIAFGGTSYELKELHAGAPVCKGNANCIRLASVPDGKTDATTTIYLTR